MAFSATLTGTGVNVTLTNGSNAFTLAASNAAIVVGSVVQVAGLAAGTKVQSISGTTGTLSNNYTGTTGTVSAIFSSIYGSLLTISQAGATDYNTPQDIINAGFATALVGGTNPMAQFVGGLTVKWANIVSGAVFDFGNWGLYFGAAGRWLFQESSILGELRGGYMVNGTQFIKTAGPTFYSNNWNNNAANGSSMFENVSGTTNQGLFRMHNPRFVELAGNNAAFVFNSSRMTMDVENMILDYQGDSAGANAGIGAAFGTLKNTYLVKTNGGIAQTNGSNYATFDGISYVGNIQATPSHKFRVPNGYVLDGYAPQVLSTQYLGGFANNTTETYSNINLSSAGWGLNDLKTRYQRYGGTNVINFPRTVSFSFKDSSNAALTGVTLYISSAGTSLVNAVQAGDYSAKTQALVLNWTTTTAAYRVADSIVDTISQVAQFRKTGYVSQSVPYSLNLAAYSQPIFMLADPAMGSVTPDKASALTGLSVDYTNKVITGSSAHTLDEVYAWGSYSQALTANSAQPDYQSSNGGTYALASPWKLNWTAGALTMGTYNKTFNGAYQWKFSGATSALTIDKKDVVWTPAAFADQISFINGATFNITNSSTLTVNPTTNLGYGSPTMFGTNTTLNMSNSQFIANLPSNYSGAIFSANFEAAGTATVNLTNATWTINGASSGACWLYCYWSAASIINNWTVNGTGVDKTVILLGYNSQKLTGLSFGGTLNGSNAAVDQFSKYVLMDTYTYTGAGTSLPMVTAQAGTCRWVFVDSKFSNGNVFRWTANASSGYYATHWLRPTITTDKANYAPLMRLTPSAMASRYAGKTVQTAALSTVALSNFYQDSAFEAGDGALPFIDSLDNRNVQNLINWTLDFRQAGFQDQSVTFNAATVVKGAVTYTASGVVDAFYVNATTGAADAALISVNTSTKTIAAVSGSLSWSPQRLYNALKNWWATYASDTDFLSSTSGSTLNLGDYNVNANISFTAGNSTDVLTGVRTTGLINAATNSIPVTDSRGTSTIWKFQNVTVGTSLAIWDATGTTKYFQGEVTTAGTYSLYITGGTTGTYYYAIEKYGYKREEGNFPANTGGVLFYVPSYVQDVGITQTTQATVAAYTAVDTLAKLYDYTAYKRLSEVFIKAGQLTTRDGTAVNIGLMSLVVNTSASSVEALSGGSYSSGVYSGGTITIKSNTLAAGGSYLTIIATPPKTVTANTTETITCAIEDANGDSQVTIQGGSGNFTLWKLLNSVPDDDYATGTNLGDVGNVTFRFIHADGYKIIIRDNSTAYRISCPMEKGVYTRGLFFGDQVQLAQSAEVTQINSKVDVLQTEIGNIMDNFNVTTDSLHAIRGAVDGVPAAVLASTVETGATVVESLRLHNAVLGGIVSGAGTGTETFRDLADTKDRLISSVDANGNRTAEVADLT